MSHKCPQCDSVTINGVFTHELGCPIRAQELREANVEEDLEEDLEDQKSPVLISRQMRLSEIPNINAYMAGYFRHRDLDFNDDVEISVSLAGEFQDCDLVHIANMNSLNEIFGAFFCNAQGELDNDMLQEMSDKEFENLEEILSGLNQYPLISEEEHSTLENEIHEERIPELARDVESVLDNADEENPFTEKQILEMTKTVYWDCVYSGEVFIEHDYACVEEKEFVQTVIDALYHK